MLVYLASGSPRRIDMLNEAGIVHRVVIPDVNEHIHLDMTPGQMVMSLALRKCLDAQNRIEATGDAVDCALFIAADTIVYDGQVIGKPSSEQDAFDTLWSLRGRMHTVYSGVCLAAPSIGYQRVFSCATQVEFTAFSSEEIRRYVATGEPMDKAGSYAIQGGFAPYIRSIEGLRSNVIGFPMEAILAELAAAGIRLQTRGTGASETEPSGETK